ncbi:MAG: phthiocerol/phthiodiolone dimycocerosyl transferase family protein [Chitinophagales bacterium]
MPLQKIHAIWTVINDLTPYNALRVFRIKGPLSESLLRKTLDLLQIRHPLTKISIVENRNELYFTDKNVGKIPLIVDKVENTAEAIRTKIEAEALHRFDDASLPLFRTSLIAVENETDDYILLLNTHHAVIDGVSYMNYGKELLAICAALAAGKTPENIAPLAKKSYNSIDFFDKKLFSLGSKFQFAGYVFRQIKNDIRKPDKQILKAAENENAIAKTGIYSMYIDGKHISAIIKKARIHQTTLHGAVCAALMLAEYEFYQKNVEQQEKIHFKCFSPVDLRPFIQPKLAAKHLGCHVSAAGTVHELNSKTDFWELATDVKKRIQLSIKRNEIFFNRMYGVQFAKAARKGNNLKAGALSVSNLGRLPFGRSFGKFTITNSQIHVTNSSIVSPNLALVVYTFDQKLYFDYSFAKHLLTHQQVAKIATRTTDFLLNSF